MEGKFRMMHEDDSTVPKAASVNTQWLDAHIHVVLTQTRKAPNS